MFTNEQIIDQVMQALRANFNGPMPCTPREAVVMQKVVSDKLVQLMSAGFIK